MQMTLEMTVTLDVTDETAVVLAAAARALSLGYSDMNERMCETLFTMSSIGNALTELMMPEQAAAHIPGAEVIASVVGVAEAE